MMKKISLLTLSVAAAACLLVHAGCSKQETSSGEGGSSGPGAVVRKSIVDLIPADAVAVSAFDTTTAAYAKWKNGPYGSMISQLQSMSLSTLQGEPGTEQLKGLSALLSGIQKVGLLSMDAAQKDSVKELAYFMTLGGPSAPGGVPNIGMAYYFTAAPGTSMKGKLGELAGFLESQGFKGDKGSANGNDTLQVKLVTAGGPADAKNPVGDTLYAVASDDKLALASSQTLTARLFDPAPSPGVTSTEQYKTATQFLPANPQDSVAVAYFNLKQFAGVAASAAPGEDKEKVQANVNNLPFETLVGYLAEEDHPVMQYSLPYHAVTDVQRKIFAALASGKAPEVLKSSPANAIFFVSLDGNMLKTVKNTAVDQMDPAQQDQARAQLAPLDQLSGIGLGLANSTGASPFPEVYMIAQSEKAADVETTVKTLATGLTAASGMPATPWQQKTLDGVKVDYMMSPLGVGLFMGSTGKTLFVASSEGMANAIISANTQKSPALGGDTKEITESSAVAIYLHFGKLYDLLEGVKGTLAMFTGGQTAFDPTKYQALKNLGVSTTVIKANEKAVQIVSHLRPAPAT